MRKKTPLRFRYKILIILGILIIIGMLMYVALGNNPFKPPVKSLGSDTHNTLYAQKVVISSVIHTMFSSLKTAETLCT